MCCMSLTCSTLSFRVPLVSSFGRIRSKLGIVSRDSLVSDGYLVTNVGGSRKKVHRLVARAFLGAPPSLAQSEVNHKDGRRYNNHVENLEYVTRSENALDAWKRRDRNVKALCKAVLGRQHGHNEWSYYPSVGEAAKCLNLHSSQVSQVCRGLYRSTGGYEFQYANSTPGALPDEEWRVSLHPNMGTPMGTNFVSSHGRVMSSSGRISFGSFTHGGYRRSAFWVDGKSNNCLVHRVVARTFLGPCQIQGPWYVNHKDNDPSNNRVANLEYVTPAGNSAHWLEMAARRGYARHGNAKPVLGRPCGAGDWTFFRSCAEAARHFNIPRARILAACRGEGAPDQKHEFAFDGRASHPVEPEVLRGEEWVEMVYDI
ncbi:unnamed protein product [Prorocentrum cordatum]|uniref:HNH nuclease domain-containing protein n=1 Tax=Prorocentrum cordatum TaxID=2364126 RepID=A0ABN9URU3_9DINO|nr:unnamed protein product [Polarella glacialis]